MKSSKFFSASLILVAMCAIGCQGSSDNSSTTASNTAANANPNQTITKTETEKSSTENGWNVVKTEAGLSISEPADWKSIDLTSGDIDKIAAAAKDNVSGMSEEQLKAMMSNKSIKMFLFAPADQETKFAPNLNVIETPLPEKMTLDQIGPEIEKGMTAMGAKKLAEKQVKLPAGDALQTEWSIPTKSSGTLHDLMYAIVNGNQMDQLTFSIPDHLYDKMQPDLEKMAESFTIGGSSAGESKAGESKSGEPSGESSATTSGK